ncbi:MAG: hypothetical protein QXZ02_06475 [Candidatus Bathyarchaeia archaeon]
MSKRNNPTIGEVTATPDSTQVCHICLSGVRKHTSFRCDTAIWEAFKRLCFANGLSTCDILEKLLIGFCVGFETRVAQSTTINVIVDAPRVIKRVRRRQLVYEGEVSADYGRLVDFYDSNSGGVWRKIRVENDWDVNEHGHFVGCRCMLCKRER